MSNKRKDIINLRYVILVFQIIILLLSSYLGDAVTYILMGLTILAMAYNSYKQFGNNAMIWIYLIIGILIIVLGVADIYGYQYI